MLFYRSMNKHYPWPVKKYLLLFALISCLLTISLRSNAQYFGQNKVRYKKLKFKVYKTPHFEIYYYLKNDSMLKRFCPGSRNLVYTASAGFQGYVQKTQSYYTVRQSSRFSANNGNRWRN